jgi:hypothetical protein
MARKPLAAPFESWIEQQIREAQERGLFDDLPGTEGPPTTLAPLDVEAVVLRWRSR